MISSSEKSVNPCTPIPHSKPSFTSWAQEVKEGFECGIGVQGFTDFSEDDIIECYEIKEIKRTLK